MQLRHHIAASTLAATAVYAVSDSAAMAVVTLLSGILVDCDHVIDYLVLHRPPHSMKDMFEKFYASRLTHVLVVLHSWELLAIIACAALATGWHPVLTGLFIGLGHHLLLDQIFNNVRPLGYFLSYRIYYRLSFSRCFRSPPNEANNEKVTD
jgi:membrane-bound metal-dependent hydrolase YbcI (DUF457 family)